MKEITIGQQVWAKKDLKVFRFRNGDEIPIVQDAKAWSNLETSAMCINPDTGAVLYNWWAVNDPRGLAPEGWKIPTDADWDELVQYLGGEHAAGLKMKSEKWGGTNESKFSALPNALRYPDGEYLGSFGFHYVEEVGCGWWAKSPPSSLDFASLRYLYAHEDYVYQHRYLRQNGFGVRCLLDV